MSMPSWSRSKIQNSRMYMIRLLIPSQVHLAVVTTLPFTCFIYGLPAQYWQEESRRSFTLDTIEEADILDPPYARPGRIRANSVGSNPKPRSLSSSRSETSQHSTRIRRHSQPTPPPTLAERVALGPQLNPWHPQHPHRLARHSSLQEIYILRKEQRLKEAADYEERLIQLRLQRRRSSRQLDGSRSAGSSPNISRTNSERDLSRTSSWKSFAKELASFEKFGPLGRTNTSESAASSRSEQSNRSRKSNLRRVLILERANSDDRGVQGHEARKKQQLRQFSIGADSEPNIASHGGQGFGVCPGKHPDKSTRYVCCSMLGDKKLTCHSERTRDLWTESMFRRDKLRPDFLKKSWGVHRRTQSIQ